MIIEKVILQDFDESNPTEIQRKMLKWNIVSPGYIKKVEGFNPNEPNYMYKLIKKNFTWEKFLHLWGDIHLDGLSTEMQKLYWEDLSKVLLWVDYKLWYKTSTNLLIYWQEFDEHLPGYAEFLELVKEDPMLFQRSLLKDKHKHLRVNRTITSEQLFVNRLSLVSFDFETSLPLTDFYRTYTSWAQDELFVPASREELIKVLPSFFLSKGEINVDLNEIYDHNFLKKLYKEGADYQIKREKGVTKSKELLGDTVEKNLTQSSSPDISKEKPDNTVGLSDQRDILQRRLSPSTPLSKILSIKYSID